MIGVLQGENENLNNKYLKKKSKRVGRKYQEASGEFCSRARWL